MNARQELLNVMGEEIAQAAYMTVNAEPLLLKYRPSEADWETFLNKLDFEYDPQNMDVLGIVWLYGGSWLTREFTQFDGWVWVLNQRPPVPIECLV